MERYTLYRIAFLFIKDSHLAIHGQIFSLVETFTSFQCLDVRYYILFGETFRERPSRGSKTQKYFENTFGKVIAKFCVTNQGCLFLFLYFYNSGPGCPHFLARFWVLGPTSESLFTST